MLGCVTFITVLFLLLAWTHGASAASCAAAPTSFDRYSSNVGATAASASSIAYDPCTSRVFWGHTTGIVVAKLPAGSGTTTFATAAATYASTTAQVYNMEYDAVRSVLYAGLIGDGIWRFTDHPSGTGSVGVRLLQQGVCGGFRIHFDSLNNILYLSCHDATDFLASIANPHSASADTTYSTLIPNNAGCSIIQSIQAFRRAGQDYVTATCYGGNAGYAILAVTTSGQMVTPWQSSPIDTRLIAVGSITNAAFSVSTNRVYYSLSSGALLYHDHSGFPVSTNTRTTIDMAFTCGSAVYSLKMYDDDGVAFAACGSSGQGFLEISLTPPGGLASNSVIYAGGSTSTALTYDRVARVILASGANVDVVGLPCSNTQLSTTCGSYVWVDAPGNTCSQPCGGGTYNITCVNTRTNNVTVSPSLCNPAVRPSYPCNVHSCAWTTSSSYCSVACGGGVQVMNNTCYDPITMIPVANNSICNATAAPPSYPCNSHSCAWSTYATSPCTESCGGGYQAMNNTCYDPVTTTTVTNARCNATATPPTFVTCGSDPCITVNSTLAPPLSCGGSNLQLANLLTYFVPANFYDVHQTVFDPCTGTLILGYTNGIAYMTVYPNGTRTAPQVFGSSTGTATSVYDLYFDASKQLLYATSADNGVWRLSSYSPPRQLATHAQCSAWHGTFDKINNVVYVTCAAPIVNSRMLISITNPDSQQPTFNSLATPECSSSPNGIINLVTHGKSGQHIALACVTVGLLRYRVVNGTQLTFQYNYRDYCASPNAVAYSESLRRYYIVCSGVGLRYIQLNNILEPIGVYTPSTQGTACPTNSMFQLTISQENNVIWGNCWYSTDATRRSAYQITMSSTVGNNNDVVAFNIGHLTGGGLAAWSTYFDGYSRLFIAADHVISYYNVTCPGVAFTPKSVCPVIPVYEWNTTRTSADLGCSKMCGGGTTSYNASCVEMNSRKVVSPAYCTAVSGYIPTITETCNTHACVWNTQPLTSCSERCNGGTYTQNVTCFDPATSTFLSDASCSTGKPSTTPTCNTHTCSWTVIGGYNSWSSCTQPCDGGYQTRDVQCIDPVTNITVASSRCETQATNAQPNSWQVCNPLNCTFAILGQCDQLCGSGHYINPVGECREPYGNQLVYDDYCLPHVRIVDALCNTHSCAWQYTVAPQSNCSAQCGGGTVYHNTWCYDPNTTTVVPKNLCTTPEPTPDVSCNTMPCCSPGLPQTGGCKCISPYVDSTVVQYEPVFEAVLICDCPNNTYSSQCLACNCPAHSHCDSRYRYFGNGTCICEDGLVMIQGACVVPPTTPIPTTPAPTTPVPTTAPPTTPVPTTPVPTTPVPTTADPTTPIPTTWIPTTGTATTPEPTTLTPTPLPSTPAPSTATATTAAPTTPTPSPSVLPSTPVATTPNPTTAVPTTAQATTATPTTLPATEAVPTTALPTTVVPTTVVPTTVTPTTMTSNTTLPPLNVTDAQNESASDSKTIIAIMAGGIALGAVALTAVAIAVAWKMGAFAANAPQIVAVRYTPI